MCCICILYVFVCVCIYSVNNFAFIYIQYMYSMYVYVWLFRICKFDNLNAINSWLMVAARQPASFRSSSAPGLGCCGPSDLGGVGVGCGVALACRQLVPGCHLLNRVTFIVATGPLSDAAAALTGCAREGMLPPRQRGTTITLTHRAVVKLHLHDRSWTRIASLRGSDLIWDVAAPRARRWCRSEPRRRTEARCVGL